MYEQRTTQENQILDKLRESNGSGVYAYELAKPRPEGCGILQYNARIFGLRKKGYRIVSDFKGHYILQEEHINMTADELQIKLAELRIDWRNAKGKDGMRKLIKARADVLIKRFKEDHEEHQLERKEEYDASKAWEELQKPENA